MLYENMRVIVLINIRRDKKRLIHRPTCADRQYKLYGRDPQIHIYAYPEPRDSICFSSCKHFPRHPVTVLGIMACHPRCLITQYSIHISVRITHRNTIVNIGMTMKGGEQIKRLRSNRQKVNRSEEGTNARKVLCKQIYFCSVQHLLSSKKTSIRTFLYDIHLYISQMSFSFANKLFFSIKNHILILLSKVQLYCNQCMCYHTVYIMY